MTKKPIPVFRVEMKVGNQAHERIVPYPESKIQNLLSKLPKLYKFFRLFLNVVIIKSVLRELKNSIWGVAEYFFVLGF